MFDERAAVLLDGRRTPPPTALRASPLTIDQLDAHADRDRIWATLLTIRAHVRSDAFFECSEQERKEATHLEIEGEVSADALLKALNAFVKGGFTSEGLRALYALLPEGWDVGA